MNHKLQVTLVGAGGYGRAHINALRQMEEEGIARLTDVVDPFPEQLPQVREVLAERGVRWHRSWEDLLLVNPTPDCVTIAAPMHHHLDYAKKAHAAGAYVYLEKPPVPLLGQLDELLALDGEKPRIQVGFAFPYCTQMQRLKGWLGEGRLGKIVSYRMMGCFSRGGEYYSRNSWAGKLFQNGRPVFDGPATNALAHRIHDLLTIEGFSSRTLAAPRELHAELYRARPLESYDVCCARGVFASGSTFALSLFHATTDPTDFILEIRGEKGWAKIGGTKLELTASFAPECVRGEDEAIFVAFRHFLTTARERGRPRVGLAETRPYVATTNAMLLSSRGIHPIGDRHYQKEDGPRGDVYNVTGLKELAMKAFREGRNFSEVGAPWGIAGEPIDASNLSAAAAQAFFARLGSSERIEKDG